MRRPPGTTPALAAHAAPAVAAHGRRKGSLTDREIQCLALIARGMTDQDIAAHLGITRSTVRFHLDNVRDRLGARNRSSAVYIAAKSDII